MSNRAVLHIPLEQLLGNLRVEGLPDDTRLVGVVYDIMCNSLNLMLVSAAFDPVMEGTASPHLPLRTDKHGTIHVCKIFGNAAASAPAASKQDVPGNVCASFQNGEGGASEPSLRSNALPDFLKGITSTYGD